MNTPFTSPSTSRRSYTAALKLHAAQWVREQNLPIAQVCQDLQVSRSMLYRWLAQVNTNGGCTSSAAKTAAQSVVADSVEYRPPLSSCCLREAY